MATLAFWSVGPIFIKALTGSLDSFTQNALRYLVACGFAFPFLMAAARRGQFDRRIWRKAIGPAIPNVFMQTLWAATLYYADPALVSLLSKTSILWVAAFSVILFAEERRLLGSPRFWAGLSLALTGVVGVVYFKAGFAAAGTQFGIALALAEAFFSALYTLSIRRCLQDVNSQVGFFVVSLYTTAGLWVLAVMFGHPGRALGIGLCDWAFVVISGITAIALAHTFYYAAIKRIGATIPALIILAQPFGVLLLSSFVFGEQMNAYQLLFGVVLLSGAGLAIWARVQPASD